VSHVDWFPWDPAQDTVLRHVRGTGSDRRPRHVVLDRASGAAVCTHQQPQVQLDVVDNTRTVVASHFLTTFSRRAQHDEVSTRLVSLDYLVVGCVGDYNCSREQSFTHISSHLLANHTLLLVILLAVSSCAVRVWWSNVLFIGFALWCHFELLQVVGVSAWMMDG